MEKQDEPTPEPQEEPKPAPNPNWVADGHGCVAREPAWMNDNPYEDH